jgi:hypothetical protein
MVSITVQEKSEGVKETGLKQTTIVGFVMLRFAKYKLRLRYQALGTIGTMTRLSEKKHELK